MKCIGNDLIYAPLNTLNKKTLKSMDFKVFLYPGRDLNPHGLYGHRILSPACLPVPPPGHRLFDSQILETS